MLDESYTLATDKEGLENLSTHLGVVLSFVIETAGGCAFFSCLENSRLLRKINYNDGEITTDGQPLTEEMDIDISSFYTDLPENLICFWRQMHSSPIFQLGTRDLTLRITEV